MRDAEVVFTTVERNKLYLRQWLPWVDHTYSAEDVRMFISRARSQLESNQGPQAGIWDNGEFIGSVGCHPIDWANRNCSIGYWIEPGSQGKGLVSRSCVVLLDYLFHELALHRVEIRCGVGNKRSCAIPARLGFVCESTAREAEWVNDHWVDLLIWSMLENEWSKRKA